MKLRVLDLFCGGGGFSLGFSREGFQVFGIDYKDYAIQTYEFNKIGIGYKKDLRKETINENFDIIIGGPPCRPWTLLNRRKRLDAHEDYILIDRFFEFIINLKPLIFVFENVFNIKNDMKIYNLLDLVSNYNYDIDYRIIYYKDYGAATNRKRFFALGVLNEIGKAKDIWEEVEKYKDKPKTVREVIYWLNDIPYGGFSDHEWVMRKITERDLEKCRKKIFGHRFVEWDNLCASFGRIFSCYQIHPSYFEGKEPRLLSVREALCIMGFPLDYRFPLNISIYNKYQMVADAVSPLFSQALAKGIKDFLIKRGLLDKNIE